VLRSEPGCSETLRAARSNGLDAVAGPLFVIEPEAWDIPHASGFDGILAGSANVFRFGGANLRELQHLPVHAVGERTAQAAQLAGFRIASVGGGGLQRVLSAISAPARLLRLAGQKRVPLHPGPGVSILERVVYRSVPRPLSPEVVALLSVGAVVLLHSSEAARAFEFESRRIGIDRTKVGIAALADPIVQAAGNGWHSVRVAAQVTDRALLALAEDMCQ
jgi:uroporphyrinogen-III synthase